MILALLVMLWVGFVFGLVTAALLAANRSAERVEQAFRSGIRVGTLRAASGRTFRPRTWRAA